MSDKDTVTEEPEVFRSPLGVSTDEEGDQKVRVIVILPDIKPKMMSSTQPSNATIDLKIEPMSFQLTVVMTKKTEKFRYQVKKLPGEIVPEKSHHKVKKGQIVILLHKAKAISWSRQLAQTGLETEREDAPFDDQFDS